MVALVERTLHRRLRAEGTTFRELVGEVRVAEARRLVGESLTVEHVAARLGYGDTAAFRRAFKRYTGTTPGRLAQLGRSAVTVRPSLDAGEGDRPP